MSQNVWWYSGQVRPGYFLQEHNAWFEYKLCSLLRLSVWLIREFTVERTRVKHYHIASMAEFWHDLQPVRISVSAYCDYFRQNRQLDNLQFRVRGFAVHHGLEIRDSCKISSSTGTTQHMKIMFKETLLLSLSEWLYRTFPRMRKPFECTDALILQIGWGLDTVRGESVPSLTWSPYHCP